MALLNLPNGYYDLAPGKLVNVVTCLEMRSNPLAKTPSLPPGYALRRVDVKKLDSYRTVFRKVGEDNMWFSRLIMPDENLAAILGHPQVESYTLNQGDRPVGVLELDFKDLPNCELAFFGLAKEAIGTGLGRALMNIAISRAWEKPINRLWVHTCHFDHPNALGFYRRSGFEPYALMIEVHDDPRLQGKLPREASPQVALIEPEKKKTA
jgi:GNAT superfamily N-acetyltransferase